MKNRHSRVLIAGVVSLILLVSMAIGIITEPLTESLSLPVTGKGALTPVENLSLDALRQQYFSDLAAESNRYNFEDERWIILELEGDSLYELYRRSFGYDSFSAYCASEEGMAERKAIEEKQNDFRRALDTAGISYEWKYSYSVLNNGLAIRTDAATCRTLSTMEGVTGVYFSETYDVPKTAVTNNANVHTTGIYNADGVEYRGEGMVVAILDTGLDYRHEAFTTMPQSPAWDKDYVASKMTASPIFAAQATVDEVYYNAKIPYAYDYADDDADVYPMYSSHGTHVAGIVAGKSDYVVNEATGETFIGVAPEAQLVICKVFTDNLDSDSLGGANSIDILAAVSDCVELGVDVINMSLGSSGGFSDGKSNRFLNEVYARVKDAGISLVVAASNDYSSGFGGGNGTNLASNPDSGTVGSPSTYDAAISVASINGQKSAYLYANDDMDQVAFITESSDENGNRYDFVDQLYQLTGKDKSEELRFKYVVIGGVGRTTNYTAKIKRELNDSEGYDGTIALIRRGDITFAEKVQNAMDNGATACIVYNNLSGTIRMSLGEIENPIPTCSIGMDAGEVLVNNAVGSVGTIHIRAELKAGPFMSDFSSWGPTPDLQLRPDITAHGGDITSAVAGGYDVYSGTSMAAPNMAGVIALLRQYLEQTTSLTGIALNARVNQILMSTATIALNEEGNPYSPRKQGAGIAGIKDAIATESYITVKDRNGNELDKTKIELYDDKEKKGVYDLVFTVHNISNKDATYRPNTYVMTETLASDKKTVAEKAYLLNDSTVEYTVNGNKLTGDTLTVPAGQSLEVKVTVTLGATGRAYLEESFENGMYVEGFVSLAAVGETKITVGVPYLAFYGDWNNAPLFDFSQYELAESQKDTGVPAEDKLVASAADTKIYGKYYDDKYIITMGSYIYNLSDSDVQIYPEKGKIALSMFDKEGQHTIYELYMVYAGLLRGAGYMDVQITDAVTGDILYFKREENVSKSYAGGGANAGSPIMLEIRADEWGLVNNGRYIVTLKGELDYPGGENPKRNTFDFEFSVDYEAPQILDYNIRYEAYTENKQTKYRIYMDIDVYDNQYVQDVMPCYIRIVNGVNTLTMATENPIPVYGGKGETSRVTYEITDIYEEYVRTGKLYLAVEDYAMNQQVYLVEPAKALGEAGSISLAEDENLHRTDIVKENTNAEKTPYFVYELTLTPNQLYKPAILADKDDSVAQNLTWVVETGGQYVLTHNDELFAVADSEGNSVILQLVYGDGDNRMVYAEVELKVTGAPKDAPKPEKLMLSPAEDGRNCIVDLNTVDSFDLHPNMTIALSAFVSPWYADNAELKWSTSNDAVVTVDQDGTLTSRTKGTAYITVEAVGNSRLNKRLKVTVSSDYRIINNTLYDYYGGSECVIPSNLNIMNIDEECFQNHTELRRVVLPATLTSIPKNAFKGCTNLEEVVIPGKCATVGENAFEGCQKLTKLELGMFTDQDGNVSDVFNGTITIGKNAFKDCKALLEIVNQKRLTAVYAGAFEGCVSLTSIDLTALRVAGTGAFAKCTGLTSVALAADTAVGEGMFSGCTSLTEITYPGNYLPANAFNGCRKLTVIRFTSENFTGIGEYALANTKISQITLPDGAYTVGGGAFTGCTKLTTVALSGETHLLPGTQTPFDGCTLFTAYAVPAENVYHHAEDGILYNKDTTELVSVPFAKEDLSSIPSTVNRIASGAFAGITSVREWDLSSYVSVGAYAFAGSGLTSVTLPASMTELPEGIFSGCVNLVEIRGTESITHVGSYAFSSCAKLETLDLPTVVDIGTNAFRYSGLKMLNAPLLSKVGDRAFERTALVEINFPALTVIGDYTFASMQSLKTATLGTVEKMGEYVFSGSTRLESVSFAEGTKEIGNYAFFTQGGNYTLDTVLLPDGVSRIGDYAFANVLALSGINLSTVTEIGQYAFANDSSLTSVDLSSVRSVGDAAFYATGLTSVELPLVETIGDSAFASTPLTSVTFGALRVLGPSAFTATKLTTVTLPDSFVSSTYEYVWNKLDDKGRVEKVRARNVESYGIGALASIDTLTEIRVASANGDFISLDGVLYVKSKNGLVLLQYPAARPGDAYTVADGTVSIAGSAFEGVSSLTSIEFPYTVKRIGAYAFYNSSVKNYTFHSVEAPVLLSEYVDPALLTQDPVLQAIYADYGSGEGLGSSIYYANFFDFVAKQIYGEYFEPSFYQPEDFGLHLVIPQNGAGYDTQIWSGFFGDIRKTETIGADDTTHAAWEAIDEMAKMSLDTIANATSLAELTSASEKVLAARRAYNMVTLSDQKALCSDRYEVLLRYESALRDAKRRLGSPVPFDRLVLESVPTKIRYQEGESFDPTGMVIKAIYADESEVILTADQYTIDKTVLNASDEFVTVSFKDQETVYTLEVRVNVQATGNQTETESETTPAIVETDTAETETFSGSEGKPGMSGIPVWGWILIGLGVAVVAGGVMICVIFLSKKKGE